MMLFTGMSTTIALPDRTGLEPWAANFPLLSDPTYVTHCVTACYYHLRRILQIRRHVDNDCLRSPIHAFITSRLDYCRLRTYVIVYTLGATRLFCEDCSAYKTALRAT